MPFSCFGDLFMLCVMYVFDYWLPVTGYQLLATPFWDRSCYIGCLYLNVHYLIILLCISSDFSHHINHVYPGFPCLDVFVMLCLTYCPVIDVIDYWLFHYWDRRL